MCPRDIAIVNSAYGKPQLLKTEGDLQFNLSHSQELVFFAFIRGRRIGIDIEKIREIPNVAQIVRRFFSLKDREDFFKLSSEDQKVDFFNKWTRMEASLKAIGQGLHFSLDEKPFSQKKFEEETLEAGEEWSFYNLNPGPDYRGALVVEGRKHRLVTQWFRFETQSIPLI
jgi:4'-phosphopantetheinyl transferase